MDIEFTKARINAICEEIIYTFMNGERMTKPVDVCALACKFFNLTVYYVRFADEEAEPYGYTCNGHVGIDIVLNNKRKNIVFPKNTILLDIRLKNDEIKRREVLTHEIMHYIESIVNAYPVEVLMMNDGSMEYSKFMDIMKKREWRADVGASVLLLPKELVINVYRERIGYDNLKVYHATKGGNMKAVVYARYSCDHQREESIEGQLRECKAYAEKNNIMIIGSYIDRAMSAKTDNRPQFQQMIKDSGKGLFEAIIVWKLDRFARNRYDSAHYKALLRKNGVKVVSATEVISEGAEGIILESVLEGFAEYYSAELSEKVIRGLTENALKCQWNGSPVPVGYTIDENKKYQINPLTSPFVKDAFEMYAGGKMIKDIVEYLNSKGVKSSYGKPMTKTTVTAIFNNTKYRGQYKYRDVVIEGGVPRIVSDELFQKVQDRLAKNKISRSHFKAKVEYFLSTKMICSECGAMMVGECGTSKSGVVHNYYKCSNVKKRMGCHKPSIKKELAEELVLDKVMTEMFTEDMIDDIADSVMKLQKRENTSIPLLKQQLAEVEKGIENMLNAMQAGVLTKSTKKRLDDLEARKEQIEIDISREKLQQEVLTRDMVVMWLRKMKELDLTNDDNKRILIDTFVNSIQVFDDKLIISFNNSEGTSEVPLLTEGCSSGSGVGELKKPENIKFSGF